MGEYVRYLDPREVPVCDSEAPSKNTEPLRGSSVSSQGAVQKQAGCSDT